MPDFGELFLTLSSTTSSESTVETQLLLRLSTKQRRQKVFLGRYDGAAILSLFQSNCYKSAVRFQLDSPPISILFPQRPASPLAVFTDHYTSKTQSRLRSTPQMLRTSRSDSRSSALPK